MVPLRYVFRSRWAALVWAGGICLTAGQFARHQHGDLIDAANSADNQSATVGALAAEEGG